MQNVEVETVSKKKSVARKALTYGILALVLIGGGLYGWRFYQDLQAHIETDDAQIEGNIVPVLTRVSGYVGKVLVEDNQVVAQGQLIATIDSVELQSRLEQAIAAYENAQAAVEVARSAVHSAQEQQRLAIIATQSPQTNLSRAQSEYVRYKDLYDQRLATPQQFESITAERDNAKAQVALARQRHEEAGVQAETARNQVKVAEKTVQQRAKDVDYARLQLSYSKIVAPVAGVISKKTVQPGQLVQAGQPLLSVVQGKQLWVTANFKETQLAEMKIGQPVHIKVDAYPGIDFTGKVESFGGATGSKFSLLPPDNASGNYVKVVQRVSVRIALDRTPEVDNLLRPGLSVIARVTKTS